jgi:hypothetical protein
LTIKTIFSAGAQAKAYVEVAEWYAKHTEDIRAKDILVPFFGFGRMGSGMCRDDTTVTGCDYLHLSACIVRGIFSHNGWVTRVDKPRFHKGKVVAGEFLKDIDIHSAGFIDWITENGSYLDQACIGMAIPGQTMRGWMSTWTGSFDKFYDKFEQLREDCKAYIPMPGNWVFHEADFFGLIDRHKLDKHYDVLAIDPPRLVGSRDMYSRGWRKFNEALGGAVRIPPWTDKNYFVLLHKLMKVNSDYVLFTWTKGAPETERVKALLLTYGVLEDETHWQLYNKDIYGWRIRRQDLKGEL